MRSKIVIHSLNTDHILSFDNIKILDTCCKHYEARIFLEGWRTTAGKSNSINEVYAVALRVLNAFVESALNAYASQYVTLLLF